ncbi:hypothetical protein [Uliginosibacterium gangwonense]|uniref:hypothetical protein n=1 Tax=Uliginosibacterium gangwonense TaxID=392736 RepID=UPI0003678EFF|nr:hypothetical protein [Uliginosibacterium gangwonense]
MRAFFDGEMALRYRTFCKILAACLLMMHGLIAQAAEMPKEVQTFIQRRDTCDHFRGEEGYSKARQALINRRLHQYCTGTDAQLARLKRKYAGNPEIIEKMDAYEATIEISTRRTR